jgi:hypothetical protein
MWNLDRRVAAVAALSAALVLGITIAVADGPSPARPGNPVALAQELAALANRGARATWMVTFAFTRTTGAGGKLHATLVSAHVTAASGRSIDVDEGLGSLVVGTAARSYSCTSVSDKPQCLARPRAGGATRPGDVYGGAVVGGRYAISRAPAANIAGVEAQCFVLRLSTGNPIAGLGFSSEQCYSADGVPLRSRVQSSGALDERVALTVRRVVGRGELLAVLEPYGLSRVAFGR